MCFAHGKHFISSGLIRDKHKTPFLLTESSKAFVGVRPINGQIIRLCSSFMSRNLHKEIEIYEIYRI